MHHFITLLHYLHTLANRKDGWLISVWRLVLWEHLWTGTIVYGTERGMLKPKWSNRSLPRRNNITCEIKRTVLKNVGCVVRASSRPTIPNTSERVKWVGQQPVHSGAIRLKSGVDYKSNVVFQFKNNSSFMVIWTGRYQIELYVCSQSPSDKRISNKARSGIERNVKYTHTHTTG